MISIPLLKDSHNHFFTYSALNKAADLFHIDSKENAIDKITNTKYDKILIAKGWFDSYYNFSIQELNSFPPLIIINNSLHKYIFNDAAADIIKLDFPEWVLNNHNQNWVEKNLIQILSYISGLFKFNLESYQSAKKAFLSLGVAEFSDMYVTDKDIFDFCINNEVPVELWTEPDLYPNLELKHQQKCSGVKIFTDGALGACTAAIESYKINPNPILTYTQKELNEKLEKLLALNTCIAIHCIGDFAIEQVINSIEKNKSKLGKSAIRLEHAQFITKKQAFRSKDLGLILSMQPNFNWDSVIYSDRLSLDYCKSNNPFRMLIDDASFTAGSDLIFGSDGMPTGIEGCIQQSLFPPVAGQKLSLDEFVAGYCIENTKLGYIQLEIDKLKKRVTSEAILNIC